MTHVFGPVPSRRLGLSLGIDPLTPKTCSMNCVYCELGPTARTTVRRTSPVDASAIADEVAARLPECPGLDFLTVSGSGEPTLYADLALLIEKLHRISDLPVAVLTNASLMTDPEVCAALAVADVVAPSLDAVTPEVFRRVNRPHSSLDAVEISRAIARFSASQSCKLWLEMLFVRGMNDDPEEIARLARAVRDIRPDRVHINTVVRPPANSSARPVDAARLGEIASLVSPQAEVIAAPSSVEPAHRAAHPELVVAEMAARRPVTSADIARAIGREESETTTIIASLIARGVLELVQHGETRYYRARPDRGRP